VIDEWQQASVTTNEQRQTAKQRASRAAEDTSDIHGNKNSGTTGVADDELGGNNGSASNMLMDNDGNVRQYDSTAAAAVVTLHGDHARRRHMARTSTRARGQVNYRAMAGIRPLHDRQSIVNAQPLVAEDVGAMFVRLSVRPHDFNCAILIAQC
jgi:hypothetical protein